MEARRGVREPEPDVLAAKQAITDVLCRYCRAMDRMDRALALSCWHARGTDDHSPNYAGPAEGFLDWLWPVHAGFLSTRHCLGNILIEVDGERAASESYCSVILRFRRDGAVYDLFSEGRYLDRFERLDGVWAIRHRQSLADSHRVARLDLTLRDFSDPPLMAPGEGGGPAVRPRRDERDVSYAYLPSEGGGV
jgi:hypothetical protein